MRYLIAMFAFCCISTPPARADTRVYYYDSAPAYYSVPLSRGFYYAGPPRIPFVTRTHLVVRDGVPVRRYEEKVKVKKSGKTERKVKVSY